jgi:hypothetical protein
VDDADAAVLVAGLEAEDGGAGPADVGDQREEGQRLVGELTDGEDVIGAAGDDVDTGRRGEDAVVLAADVEADDAGVDLHVVGGVLEGDAAEEFVASGDDDVDIAGVGGEVDRADAGLALVDRVEVDLEELALDLVEGLGGGEDVRLAGLRVEVHVDDGGVGRLAGGHDLHLVVAGRDGGVVGRRAEGDVRGERLTVDQHVDGRGSGRGVDDPQRGVRLLVLLSARGAGQRHARESDDHGQHQRQGDQPLHAALQGAHPHPFPGTCRFLLQGADIGPTTLPNANGIAHFACQTTASHA